MPPSDSTPPAESRADAAFTVSARKPIFVEKVLEDPSVFRGLVEANAPYAPVQRYFANEA